MEDTIPLHRMLKFEHEPLEPGVGRAVVRMPVHDDALGATGNLHGGAIATMVDFACALAAVGSSGFDHTRESLVTADMHIRYLGRPRTDTVVATAEVIRNGKQLIVVGCEVDDTDGHQVAVGDFSMMIVPLRDPLSATSARVPGAPEL